MYLNTYGMGTRFSGARTRFYMAFLMGAAMAAIMLALHARHVHKSGAQCRHLSPQSAAVFILALFLVRSQATIGG